LSYGHLVGDSTGPAQRGRCAPEHRRSLLSPLGRSDPYQSVRGDADVGPDRPEGVSAALAGPPTLRGLASTVRRWRRLALCARSERPDEALAAPTRRGFPAIAIRWRRASGGGGVNRRSDRQRRSGLAFPSVAKHSRGIRRLARSRRRHSNRSVRGAPSVEAIVGARRAVRASGLGGYGEQMRGERESRCQSVPQHPRACRNGIGLRPVAASGGRMDLSSGAQLEHAPVARRAVNRADAETRRPRPGAFAKCVPATFRP